MIYFCFRNKQLRAHLVSEVADTRFTTDDSSTSQRQGRVKMFYIK